MQKVFDNLVNGNITDAKKGAKRHSLKRLNDYAGEKLGWFPGRAWFAAAYLKGVGSFQDYCDAK